MFANHFYNESTRRMVSVFGSIFNDLQVVKKDAAGKILQKIQGASWIFTKNKSTCTFK